MLLRQAVPLNKQRLQRLDAAMTFSTISTQRLDFTQQELPDAAAWAIPEKVAAYRSNFPRFRRLTVPICTITIYYTEFLRTWLSLLIYCTSGRHQKHWQEVRPCFDIGSRRYGPQNAVGTKLFGCIEDSFLLWMKLSQVLQNLRVDPWSWIILGPKLEAQQDVLLHSKLVLISLSVSLVCNFRSEDMGRCRKPLSNPEECGFSMVGLVSEDSDRPGRQAFLSVLRPSLRDDRNFETLQGWSLALPRHSGSADACCRFLWAFSIHRPWLRKSISTRIHHDPLVFVGDVFILR